MTKTTCLVSILSLTPCFSWVLSTPERGPTAKAVVVVDSAMHLLKRGVNEMGYSRAALNTYDENYSTVSDSELSPSQRPARHSRNVPSSLLPPRLDLPISGNKLAAF